MNAEISHFTTSDGLKLFYQWWVPDAPKAVLLVVHGIGDHSGRYGPFIKYFVQKGFAVAIYDQRGHGRSDGERGHAEQLQDFMQDLAQFLQLTKARFPQLPLVLVGHSFGGQIALNFLVRYAKGVRGVILSSPNIEMSLPVPTWKKRMAVWVQNSAGHLRLGHTIDARHLSHNPVVVKAYEADPLVFSHVTARLGSLIMHNLEIMMALASRIHLPALFLHAGDDVICSPEGTRAFYNRVPVAKKRLIVYDGFYHELFNEADNDRVFADMAEWLGELLRDDVTDTRSFRGRLTAPAAGVGERS